MFEFFTSANKYDIQTQIDYFERAIKDSKSNDRYLPDANSSMTDRENGRAMERPSEESIAKVREWIAKQRSEYSDSKEILDLCDRWEKLFGEYELKMAIERHEIQKESEAARTEIRKEQSASKPNEKPATAAKPSSKPSDSNESAPEPLAFNRSNIARLMPRIERVRSALKQLETPDGSKGVENASALRELGKHLESAISEKDAISVLALQEKILALNSKAKFTASRNAGKPDGLFGDITMGHLESALNVVSKSKEDAAPAVNWKPSSSAAEKAAAKWPAVFRMRDGNPVKMKDGTPVVGMRFEKGAVMVIGKNGQRVELSAFSGSENAMKAMEALTENAKKLESVVDDALVMLSAVAEHAVSNKWKSAPEYMKRARDFEEFITTIDPSDYGKAKMRIVAFVHETFAAGGDLRKEFEEVFVASDNDADRRKKVYEYVRGSFWPTRRHAGFDGASDSLSKKLSANELARLNVSPDSVAKFVTELVDTKLRNKKPSEVAKEIFSTKDKSGIRPFLVQVFKTESALASFIEDVRDSNEELEKAYASKEAKKAYESVVKKNGEPLTQEEIASLMTASRKAKLGELISARSLVAYVRANPTAKNGNFDLETFADIEGATAFDMSDRTKKYCRNELWKDIAIEVAAIGLWFVTAGWGAAGVHALAATRWGVRGVEALRIGSRVEWAVQLNAAGRVVVWTVWGWAGFEAGHGAVRTAKESYKNGELTSAYSWESLAQSMAFWGALSATGEILRSRGIVLDVTKKLSEQKATLAMVVWADVVAAVGVSGGIASWTGEKWTVEEVLQAALMAAAFRGAMTGAEKFRLRAVRSKTDGVVEVVPEPVVEPTVAEARKTIADRIRALRAESKDLKEQLKINRELLQNPDLNPASKRQIESKIFEMEERMASIWKEIDAQSAFAPKKEPVVKSAETAAPAAPEPAPEQVVVNEPAPIRPTMAETVSDDNFIKFADRLVSKLKKPGHFFEVGDMTVRKTVTAYEIKTGDSVLVVDDASKLAKTLAERISSPSARFDALTKFFSEGFRKKLTSLDGKELGAGEYRLVVAKNGEITFAKKSGNAWEKVSVETVPEAVQNEAMVKVFGEKLIRKASIEASKISRNPEDYVTMKERLAFISKFGEAAWLKVVKNGATWLANLESNAAGRGSGGAVDSHGHAVGGRGKFLRFFIGEHGSTWKGSLGWGAATQLIGPTWGMLTGEGLDGFRKLSEKDAIDLAGEILVFRYISAGRAVLYNVLWDVQDETGIKPATK